MAMDPRIKVEVNFALSRFQVNEFALKAMLRSHGGRDIARRAILVESQAKRNASTPPPSRPGQGPSVRTGRLRSSITWRLGEDAKGVYADVGTNVHYAPFVELGTTRMRARPFLRPALAAARR
jgi:HK97 gp10 family phage protein